MLRARHRYILHILSECFNCEYDWVENILNNENVFKAIALFFVSSDFADVLIFGYSIHSAIPTKTLMLRDIVGGGKGQIIVSNGEPLPKADQYVYFQRSKRGAINPDIFFDTLMVYGTITNTPVTSVRSYISKVMLYNQVNQLQTPCYHLDQFQWKLKGYTDSISIEACVKDFDNISARASVNLLETWSDSIETLMSDLETQIYEPNTTYSPNIEIIRWTSYIDMLCSLHCNFSTEQVRDNVSKVRQLSALTTSVCNAEGISKRNIQNLLERWETSWNQIQIVSRSSLDYKQKLSSLTITAQNIQNTTSFSQIQRNLPLFLNQMQDICKIKKYPKISSHIFHILRSMLKSIVNFCEARILPIHIAKKDYFTELNNYDTYELRESIHLVRDIVNKFTDLANTNNENSPRKYFHQECSNFCVAAEAIEHYCYRLKQIEGLKKVSDQEVKFLTQLLKNLLCKISNDQAKTLNIIHISKMELCKFDSKVAQHFRRKYKSSKTVVRMQAVLEEFRAIPLNEGNEYLKSACIDVLDHFNLELDSILDVFHKQKNMHAVRYRNAPVFVGHVMWAHNLITRIQAPMKWFRKNKILIQSDNASRIVSKYEVILSLLTDFQGNSLKQYMEQLFRKEIGSLEITITTSKRNQDTIVMNLILPEDSIRFMKEARRMFKQYPRLDSTKASTLIQSESTFDDRIFKLQDITRRYNLIIKRMTSFLFPSIVQIVLATNSYLDTGTVTLPWNLDIVDCHTTKYLIALESFGCVGNPLIVLLQKLKVHVQELGASSFFIPTSTKLENAARFRATMKALIENFVALLQNKVKLIQNVTNDLISFINNLDFNLGNELTTFLQRYHRLVQNTLLHCYLTALHRYKSILSCESKPIIRIYIRVLASMFPVFPGLKRLKAVAVDIFSMMVESSKLLVWKMENGQYEPLLFNELAKDYRCCRIGLAIIGLLLKAENRVVDYVTQLRSINSIWREGRVGSETEFKMRQHLIEQLPNQAIVGIVEVDHTNLKLQLHKLVRKALREEVHNE